jgi:hypothetical protein
MSEPAPTSPVEIPPLPSEELAEVRATIEQVRRGDLSSTLTWEEIAAELGL